MHLLHGPFYQKAISSFHLDLANPALLTLVPTIKVCFCWFRLVYFIYSLQYHSFIINCFIIVKVVVGREQKTQWKFSLQIILHLQAVDLKKAKMTVCAGCG